MVSSGRSERGTHLLIGMDGLGMLPEVIESGELLATMALKRAFASVFSGISDQEHRG